MCVIQERQQILYYVSITDSFIWSEFSEFAEVFLFIQYSNCISQSINYYTIFSCQYLVEVCKGKGKSILLQTGVTQRVPYSKIKQSRYKPGVAQRVPYQKVQQSRYRTGVALRVPYQKVKQSRYRPGVAQRVPYQKVNQSRYEPRGTQKLAGS